jgi:hypothetical protein
MESDTAMPKPNRGDGTNISTWPRCRPVTVPIEVPADKADELQDYADFRGISLQALFTEFVSMALHDARLFGCGAVDPPGASKQAQMVTAGLPRRGTAPLNRASN